MSSHFLTTTRDRTRFILAFAVVIAIVAAGVGVAAGQNQTQTGPAVTFTNQSTNGSTLTINRVSVPDGGFVIVHNALYLPPENDRINSAVGLSTYLSPGVHHNVSVSLLPGAVNQSTGSQLLVAVPSRDSNGNQSYDYIRTRGQADPAYRNASNQTVSAQAYVSPEASSTNTSANTSRSASPAVQFEDQTTNASNATVTVSSVTLPNGGFVAIQGSAYLDGVAPDTLAVSPYLSPGKHTNVSISLSGGAPGARSNRSKLGGQQRVAAVAYNDTNGNQEFDHYSASNASVDAAYTNESGRTALASAVVTQATGSGSSTPVVSIENQTSDGTTVTVSSITLRQPGFVAVSNASASGQAPPAGSVIGASKRLDAGTHRNITIQLFDVPGRNGQQRLRESQTLTATPMVDTGMTGKFEYVSSDGMNDVPVVAPNGSAIEDQASVSVENITQSATQQATAGETQSSTRGGQQTQTGTQATSAPVTGSQQGSSGQGTPIWVYAIAAICVIALVLIVWWWL